VKPAKRVCRGLWRGDGGANTGEPDVWVGTSIDADRFEVSAVPRNEDGESPGDVGALGGAERGFRRREGVPPKTETHTQSPS